MSNSIQSVQATNQQARTEQTVQPPQTPQQKIKGPTPQDQVTISEAAKQKLANNALPATKGE